METETTTEQKMETLIFSGTVRETFTTDEIALSSMIREMIADCGGDSQPTDLSASGKFNDITDEDLRDLISLWKYAATPAAKTVMEKIAVRSSEAQNVTDATIQVLADNKSPESLSKLIIIANFLAIDPLINVYASRIAKTLVKDPNAFKKAFTNST